MSDSKQRYRGHIISASSKERFYTGPQPAGHPPPCLRIATLNYCWYITIMQAVLSCCCAFGHVFLPGKQEASVQHAMLCTACRGSARHRMKPWTCMPLNAPAMGMASLTQARGGTFIEQAFTHLKDANTIETHTKTKALGANKLDPCTQDARLIVIACRAAVGPDTYMAGRQHPHLCCIVSTSMPEVLIPITQQLGQISKAIESPRPKWPRYMTKLYIPLSP